MKYTVSLTLAILCASGSAYAATINSQAAPATPQAIVSFVDCNPASSSIGQRTQASGTQVKSCSDNNVTGRSSTSFDTIRAFGEATSATPASVRGFGYSQSGSITDSILITPDDANRAGETGQVAINFDIDGTLVGDAKFFFVADYNINNSNGSISRRDAPLIEFDLDQTIQFEAGFSSSSDLVESRTNGIVDIGVNSSSRNIFSYDGTMTAIYDVIFGEYLTYTFSFGVGVDNLNGNGGIADFENTALLSSFTLFDSVGDEVSASFGTSSGEVDFIANGGSTTPSPVPVPASLPLLAAGLIGMGALARRKKSA